jgi:hypothetical protein
MSAGHTREYRLNCGQYVFHENGEPVRAVQDTIAVAIDRAEGHMVKHGSPEKVRTWHQKQVAKANEGGYPDLVNSIEVIEGRFPLDEINKLLANNAYGASFLEKLAAGEMLPIAFSYGRNSPRPQHSPLQNQCLESSEHFRLADRHHQIIAFDAENFQ